ncbi:hypothetical protein B0H16DRAFT_1481009 [Mycena metata]|uniref:Uncharacterized protein n=1 Tax=Mycena metata TaxID=1033252 RepID=A0AAD7MBE0_9AGAR|nr:hypothetical protein B0H16DRAFT_1481009 [Mycena metata]
MHPLFASSEYIWMLSYTHRRPLQRPSNSWQLNHTLGLTVVPNGDLFEGTWKIQETRRSRWKFHAESLHPSHHSIAQEAMQYPLTFGSDGNVERVGGIAFHAKSLHLGHQGISQDTVQCPLLFILGGIAFHAESLHPGHHCIAQDPLQYPLTFSFDGNVERVGGIAFRPEFVHSALHGLVYNALRYPLTFIWDGDVGCVGGIAILHPGLHGVFNDTTRYPPRSSGMATPGASRHCGAKSLQRSLSKYLGVALRANSGFISDLYWPEYFNPLYYFKHFKPFFWCSSSPTTSRTIDRCWPNAAIELTAINDDHTSLAAVVWQCWELPIVPNHNRHTSKVMYRDPSRWNV